MTDIVRRVLQSKEPLRRELVRRGGIFSYVDRAELARHGMGLPAKTQQLGGVTYAAALARADRQLVAKVVMCGLLTRDELLWLDKFLKPGYQKRRKTRAEDTKLDELRRIVERAIQGPGARVRGSGKNL